MNKIQIMIVLCLSSKFFMAQARSVAAQLNNAALKRTQSVVAYDGRYMKIAYPNGDVPASIGVCTDVIIRSYRLLGVDLQQLLHEDIKNNFSRYPSRRIWGLKHPDSNIDHRRVPNLRTFFKRRGKSFDISKKASDYKAGDIVTWMLPGNLPHIGIVTNKLDIHGVPKIVHNIGRGPKLENMLFNYKITGHYRYLPEMEK